MLRPTLAGLRREVDRYALPRVLAWTSSHVFFQSFFLPFYIAFLYARALATTCARKSALGKSLFIMVFFVD